MFKYFFPLIVAGKPRKKAFPECVTISEWLWKKECDCVISYLIVVIKKGRFVRVLIAGMLPSYSSNIFYAHNPEVLLYSKYITANVTLFYSGVYLKAKIALFLRLKAIMPFIVSEYLRLSALKAKIALFLENSLIITYLKNDRYINPPLLVRDRFWCFGKSEAINRRLALCVSYGEAGIATPTGV